MTFTLHLFGREILCFEVDLPTAPSFSDVSSAFIPHQEEDEEEYEDEPEDRTVKLGFRQKNDR